MRLFFAALTVFLLGYTRAHAQVQTFQNDYPGFVSAAGPLSTIGFNIMPDGQPSVPLTQITATFNYDARGAHFSAPVGNPYLAAGDGPGGWALKVNSDVQPRTWINADLVTPGRAVGIFFPGGTTLCAFDALGAQLGCVSWNGSGTGFFLGVVSPVDPIARVTVDRGGNIETIDRLLLPPVPEPATAILLLAGGAFVFRRRRAPDCGGKR